MSDPNWDDVLLLLSFDGADGATTDADKSGNPKTVTFHGNAQLDTAEKKFGPSSALFDGSGDQVRIANDSDFDELTGNFTQPKFTIEGWFRFNSDPAANAVLIAKYSFSSGNFREWALRYLAATNQLTWGTSSTGSSSLDSQTVSWTPTIGQWYHLCIQCNSGNAMAMYIDGVRVSTGLHIIGANRGAPITIGSYDGDNFGAPFDGWVDEVRITAGVLRYDYAGFTPPDAPFPTPEETVSPQTGHLELTGHAASLRSSAVLAAVGGELVITGHAARVAEVFKLHPPGGELEIGGHGAAIIAGGTVAPEAGELVITGYRALINESVASQVAILALTEPPPPEVRDTQLVILAAAEVVPAVRASQHAVLILADAEPCITQRCQLWKITRRDGVVLTFTSHDEDVLWGDGRTYKACNSLNPSASESASHLGSVGNIELEGIISHDDISEEDLYGGLYDDAFVEVWLVSWGDVTDTPKRLAAGWTGELSQGESGFRMEVVGPGARLEQQALLQDYTPGCRRVFGSPQNELPPGGCGVDIEALKVAGVVQDAPDRGLFSADVAAPSYDAQWPNGKVTWTSGRNEGTTQEVKTVDFDTGVIVLWVPAPFLPEYGDSFDLYPGCDRAKLGGCTVYGNIVNFGGFPDVPGPDALMETPDAKY